MTSTYFTKKRKGHMLMCALRNVPLVESVRLDHAYILNEQHWTSPETSAEF